MTAESQVVQRTTRAGGSTGTCRLITAVRVNTRSRTTMWFRQIAAPHPAHTATADWGEDPSCAQSKQFMPPSKSE
jgi:hypothetical protein